MAPEVRSIPGGYRFIFMPEQVRVTIHRLADDRRTQSTSGEIVVESLDNGREGHLHQGRINLTSTQQKDALAKALFKMDDGTRWTDIVEAVAVRTLELHRQGEPVELVGINPLPKAPAYRLYPICPEGQPGLIFGEGGTFKSYLALLFCILVQTGESACGLRPQKGNVLYLDWETSSEIANMRAKAICEGMGLPVTPIRYRYCFHSLFEDLESLQNVVNENDIQFAVIDSAAPACGGDPVDSELTIRVFNALRNLRVTPLILAHVAKNIQEGRTTTPFGSVFWWNMSRSIWEIRRAASATDGRLTVALTHRKANLGPLRQSSLGFDVEITTDGNEFPLTCSLTRTDATSNPALSRQLGTKERILASLRSGAKTTDEIAVLLGKDKGDIQPRMSELMGAGYLVKNAGGKDGFWGLKTIDSGR